MPPAYEVLLLNTAVPQIQAAQSGDTYVVPRDIAFSAALTLSAGTANGVPYLNGSKVLTTGSALVFTGTNLGVGVNPTNAKLEVFASTGEVFRADASGGAFRIVADQTNVSLNGGSNVINYVAGSEQMRLTSTGLGIGTSSPAAKLDVVGTGSIISATRTDTNRADIAVTNSGGTVNFGINNSTGNWLTNGLAYYGYILGPSSASYGLQFGVGASNTAAVTIDPSGNLGLGVTPSNAYTLTKSFEYQSGGIFPRSGETNFTFNATQNSGASWIYGATNSASLFQIKPASFVWQTAPSGTAGDPITFTQAMTLTAGGNLLVGTTNSTQRITSSAGAVDGTTGYAGAFHANEGTSGDAWIQLGGARSDSLGSGRVAYIDAKAAGTSGTLGFSTDGTERARLTNNGNFKIGGSANRATTEGDKQLVLFDGTAPVGTLANGVSFYSASGEANVMDAAGNATLLSPHDAVTNEWIFRSKHTPTGKVLKIDVERLLKFVNDHFGLDAVHEFIED